MNGIGARTRSAVPILLVALFWAAAFAAVAVHYGPDATWDLRNYHIYVPYAVLHGRLGFDIAPANSESFFPPMLDLPSYLLRVALNGRPKVLDALLALPHAAGATFATLIARRFLPEDWRPAWRWAVAVLLVGFGVTGAAGFTTVATAQSEMLPGSLVLAGFYVLLRQLGQPDAGAPRWRMLVVAGLLFGVAAGLKLTALPYGVGAAAALLATCPGTLRAKLAAAVVFGLALLASMAALGGWWWLHLWTTYGNPLFPLYNDVFRSPYGPLTAGVYGRYKPTGPLQALFYPFYWSMGWGNPVSEAFARDPRFFFALLAFWAMAGFRALGLAGAGGRQVGALLVFCGVSFALWEGLFSILRYLAPLEMLVGVLLFLPLRIVAGWRRGLPVAGLAAAAVLALTFKLTINPRWERAWPQTSAVDFQLPPLDPAGLALLLDKGPKAYVVTAMPPSLRALGVNNTTVRLDQRTVLRDQIERIIAAHRGPFYGLESPVEMPGDADRALAQYGLRRIEASCAPIPSNLDQNRIRLCTLVRAGSAQAADGTTP